MTPRKILCAMVCAASGLFFQQASAATVTIYTDGDTACTVFNGSTCQWQDFAGSDTMLAQVNWVFDNDPVASGNQFDNPQTDGGLTVTGTQFKAAPDDSDAIAFDWSWSGSTASLITFKFNTYFGVIDPMGDTSGSISLADLCTIDGYCVGTVNPQPAALSNVTVIGTVPVPAAVWLFGSGLLGLIGVARRKAAS